MTRYLCALLTIGALAPGADLAGTYTGSLILNDRDHGGAVVIEQGDGHLLVSLGPDASKLSRATQLTVAGDRLTFQVKPPGHTGDPWQCDVIVKDGTLTGTATLPEAGSVAKFAMKRNMDLAGTYAGSLIVTTPDGDRDMGATVVLKQDGGQLTVTAGPNSDQLLAATNVRLNGQQLTFDVQPPNGGEPWQFALTTEPGRLSGQVKATRDNETRIGKVDLKKR